MSILSKIKRKLKPRFRRARLKPKPGTYVPARKWHLYRVEGIDPRTGKRRSFVGYEQSAKWARKRFEGKLKNIRVYRVKRKTSLTEKLLAKFKGNLSKAAGSLIKKKKRGGKRKVARRKKRGRKKKRGRRKRRR